ncbi:HEAT repeat domain-containing protein [Gordonia zhaorongruii]|uniref:HEAT repeat domain-containing protein n=1 Tax=Gordonia zhaorongruii TaxID=2597659 RepID=UPI00104844A8|nr:HEAT repeat domain-containing protein [Gordonia zhaorongruii]
MIPNSEKSTRMAAALRAADSSTRLQAALAVGTDPDARVLDLLIERCRVESDFFVRDMLTWALTRFPVEATVPMLVAELDSSVPQARSQALHTLSKVGEPAESASGGALGVWQAITGDLLTDADDEVARSAWRAAVIVVPAGAEEALAAILATQFGRGDAAMHRSLSRAFVELGEAVMPVLRGFQSDADAVVRGHAAATERLMDDPDSAFAFDVDEARRIDAIGSGQDR